LTATTPETAAPLTRREAREIERRTGVRPVAVATGAAFVRSEAPSVASLVVDPSYDPHDTGRIERNAVRDLVSVLPTGATRIQAPVAAEPAVITASLATVASLDEARESRTVRAARPAALVAKSRRRAGAGFAAAASVAAVATVGLVLPAQGVQVDAAHQADLAAGAHEGAQVSDDAIATAAPEAAETAAPSADAAPAVVAPSEVSNARADYSVASFSAEAVSATAGGVSTGTSSQGGIDSVVTSAWVAPINGGGITDYFGYRAWTGRQHNGIDVNASIGQALYAMGPGTVTFAAVNGSYGNHVEITLDDGTVITYSHMNAIGVSVGQRVSGGDVLGEAGNTGFSTGPHLHFEVKIGGSFIDPIPWLRDRGVSYPGM